MTKNLTIGRTIPNKPLPPLRKVVDHVMQAVGKTEVLKELLECGHVLPVKQDAFGPTNAMRRRCRKCLTAEPSEGNNS